MAKVLSTAQLLALAVLQGDEASARPLVDCLLESWGEKQDGFRISPVHHVRVEAEHLRGIFYLSGDVEIEDLNVGQLNEAFIQWITGATPALGVRGIDRVEIYEMKEAMQLRRYTINTLGHLTPECQHTFDRLGGPCIHCGYRPSDLSQESEG